MGDKGDKGDKGEGETRRRGGLELSKITDFVNC